MNPSKPTRRDVCRSSAALALGAVLRPPARALGREPVRVAVVGPGKRGMNLMRGAFLGEDFAVTAVCDVDTTRLEAAKALADERQGGDCFATQRHEEAIARDDVDAVVIATPDHWHAHQILDAAAAGKHVYCEKPLTLTLAEAERCVDGVRRAGVVFQTGSQQRTEYGHRFVDACERVRAGLIGRVLTVHVGVGDPPGPCELPAEELEPGLDWDRWLGQAPERPYHSTLSPRGVHTHYPRWRDYWEYAGGGLADMGAHHFDIAQWGLGRDGDGPVEAHPPEDPAALLGAYAVYDDGVRLVHGGPSGTTFVGTKGVLHVDRGRIASTPESILEDPLPEDAERLPRHPSHQADWLQAMRGEGPTTCPVEVGAGSVAICHLLNLTYRHRVSLHWDPATWRFEDEHANETPGWRDVERREGFALPGHGSGR